MKYKIIALAVSGALLTACGSDNNNKIIPDNNLGLPYETTSLQAFDGAVRYLDAFITCGNENELFVGETGNKGTIFFAEGIFPSFDADPTQCSFTFKEDPTHGSKDAIDESNGKDMTSRANGL